jgi:uncharacterized membrane protein YtjA (UPF0391 family)
VGLEDFPHMLKRARRWLLIALVAAGFGFTGLLRTTAIIAQAAFYLAAAFGFLSLLFGLFEESGPSQAEIEPRQGQVIPLPTLSEAPRPEARAA